MVKMPEAGRFPPTGRRCPELLPVLAALDGLEVGADQFDAVTFQRAGSRTGHGGVQRRLAAEGGQQGVDRLPRAACWAMTFSTKSG